MANYYLRYNDRVSGPFPIDTLKTMARDGLVTSAHSLSLDKEQWFPADQIPGLFDPPPTSPDREQGFPTDLFLNLFGPPPATNGGSPPPNGTVSPEKGSTDLLANRGCGLAMLIGGVLLLFLAHAVAPNRLGMAYGLVIVGLILPGVYALVTGKEPEK